MSTATRGARLFLLALMLVDAIGFGIIAPVIPKLIVQLTGQGLGEAAALGGWLMVTYSAMQFFAAPLLGSLSDAHGRRPVLLGSLAALVLDYLLMATAPALAWLFVGRLIAGAAGATYPTAFAVISDTTPAEARAQQFGRRLDRVVQARHARLHQAQVGAHQLELVLGHRHTHGRAILDDRLGSVFGEAFRHAVEIDLTVERREQRLLSSDAGMDRFEIGRHGSSPWTHWPRARGAVAVWNRGRP